MLQPRAWQGAAMVVSRASAVARVRLALPRTAASAALVRPRSLWVAALRVGAPSDSMAASTQLVRHFSFFGNIMDTIKNVSWLQVSRRLSFSQWKQQKQKCDLGLARPQAVENDEQAKEYAQQHLESIRSTDERDEKARVREMTVSHTGGVPDHLRCPTARSCTQRRS